jgi:uncharacterized membrane protein YfcA
MIGGPATAGILVGAALQQRIPQRAVSALLALVLIAIAADMLL